MLFPRKNILYFEQLYSLHKIVLDNYSSDVFHQCNHSVLFLMHYFQNYALTFAAPSQLQFLALFFPTRLICSYPPQTEGEYIIGELPF